MRDTERALLKKRLMGYLLLTFSLTWIPMLALRAAGVRYDAEGPETSLLLFVSMLFPAIAMLAVRYVTREGFALTGEDSLLLGISFHNKKWIWYAAAFAIPYCYWMLGDAFWFALAPESFDPGMYAEQGLEGFFVLLIPLAGIVNAVVGSVGALGEELGWRTYLYPKLEALFGMRRAVLLGGVIWGIWHFPAIAQGHTFGTGYFGEPYTGFLIFTLDTIATGCLLYLLVKKSGSVWPAVFMHAFCNTGADIWRCIKEEGLTGALADRAVQIGIVTVGTLVAGYIGYRVLKEQNAQKRRKSI